MKQPKFKACPRCGKGANIIHTCSKKGISSKLLKTVETYNQAVTEYWGSYAEEYIFLEVYEGKEEIRTDLFIKHFLNKGFIGSCVINYNIGFIVLYEEIHISELDLLLIDKLKITYDDFIKFYYEFLESGEYKKLKQKLTLELYKNKYNEYKRKK